MAHTFWTPITRTFSTLALTSALALASSACVPEEELEGEALEQSQDELFLCFGEVPNGYDDDCDGLIDEGFLASSPNCDVPKKYFRDNDEDSYGVSDDYIVACEPEYNYTSTRGGDCNDNDRNIHPLSREYCGNGLDDNCNGQVDENLNTYYRDSDGDNYGVYYDSRVACHRPWGYAEAAFDCNDNDPSIHPGAYEFCNGLDDDCDGLSDEDFPAMTVHTYFRDGDHDGFGNPQSTAPGCWAPPGYVSDNTDCNDNDANINPQMPEITDGFDNNCDGIGF